jgi:hypothetical protein
MFYIRLGEHQENTTGRTLSKPHQNISVKSKRLFCSASLLKIFPKILQDFMITDLSVDSTVQRFSPRFLFNILLKIFSKIFKITFEDLSADTLVLQRLKTFIVQHPS